MSGIGRRDVLPLDGSVGLETHVFVRLLRLGEEQLLDLLDATIRLVEGLSELGISSACALLSRCLRAP